MGLFRALLEAIMGEDENIGGMPFTRLTAQLSDTETTTMTVETTTGFGEYGDGVGDALLLVGGELIYAAAVPSTTTFGTLMRGFGGTEAGAHPPATIVYDLSRNTTALDHVRRGFLLDFAVGEDLDVIGRNLGLTKCVGITEDQWRAVIKAVAYLPKNTAHAFREALDALWGSPNYELLESPAQRWTVIVNILVPLATTLQGRFMLNGGEPQLTTGANTVDVAHAVLSPTLAAYPGSPTQQFGLRGPAPPTDGQITYPAGGVGTDIVGVYDDTPQTRRGYRDGLTNYYSGGSVLGNTITLGTSPGAAGTAVIVDYTGFSAHYLAENETTIHDQDFYAYLADPLLATRCLLEQVRAGGIQVEVRAKV